MGRNRFVERKGRRIAGTGDQTQQEGTYGCADLNDRRIVDHGGDKRLDQTHSIHTGYEHACRQNDTDDIAVGFAHAVKERLGQRRRVGPGHDAGQDGADDHSLGYAHLEHGNHLGRA